MPALTKDETEYYLSLLKYATPVTLPDSEEKKNTALRDYNAYISGQGKKIEDMDPFSIYYILSKLKDEERIAFIRTNIEFIKKKDEEIFLYHMESPKSLSYYFSLKVIRAIKDIDYEIFKKIFNGNFSNLVHGLNTEEYISLYSEFKKEISDIENIFFINNLCFFYGTIYGVEHNLGNIMESLNNMYRFSNKKFIDLIKEKYKSKIATFTPKELLMFISYIDDLNDYKDFVLNNQDRLKLAFDNISQYDLNDYFINASPLKQQILIKFFLNNITKSRDIRSLVSSLDPGVIIDLYNKDQSVFNNISLNDWVKYCAKKGCFNDSFRRIIDTFEIYEVENLFDSDFFANKWSKKNIEALRYVELKYRKKINTSNFIDEIDVNTSIFSLKYLKNLEVLKNLFKNKKISKDNDFYKQHLTNFIMFLQKQNIVTDISDINLKEIDKLFYRIVMGFSIASIYEVSSIEDIALINRLGCIDFATSDFTVEQLVNYNVKEHKQLYQRFNDTWWIKTYKKLVLKLMLMVGYKNAKLMLDLEDSLSVLEHLTDKVDVKDIIIDNQGNPVLNKRIINILFNDKNCTRIKEMLKNTDNELYKFFPRIFNEWEIIKMNNKDKSLGLIIDYLKTDEISLPVKYYRLEGQFKHIGCSNSIVNETLKLYDMMLKKVSSTIPRIKGKFLDYSYEILKFNDPDVLSVGDKTDCCFTVLGNGKSCFRHALTNKNGRILVIKRNDKIIAHSWLWRNGNLLCLDNIEVAQDINEVVFFDLYMKFADEVIKESFINEGKNNCIKNITVGYTNFDKKINGIENYPCLIAKSCNLKEKEFGKRLGNNRIFMEKLPQPIEQVDYTDSKCVQYLIRGNGIFNLKQSNYLYQDERESVLSYDRKNDYRDDFINKVLQKVNCLCYTKLQEENNLKLYEPIKINDLEVVYCNDDWYSITFKDGTYEEYNMFNDPRANLEMEKIKSKNKVLMKVKM